MKRKFLIVLLAIITAIAYAFGITACVDTGRESGIEQGTEQGGDPEKGGNTDKEEHVHTYETEWSKDASHHYHAATCEHSDQRSEYAAHNFISGVCSVCGYKLYDKDQMLEALNPDELIFGKTYVLPLPSNASFTLKVYDEFNEDEINGILRLNGDGTLDVTGIVRRGYFNIYYGDNKVYEDNVFFNIKTEQLTEKIRSVLRAKEVNTDLITQTELDQVEELDLSELFLNNADALGGLKYLTKLKILNLSNNNLNNEEIQSLSSMVELTELNLSNNNISDIDVLKNTLKLRKLDLSRNLLDTTDEYNSISALTRLGRLTHLNLEHNSIRSIVPVSNLTELVSLNLNHNKITPSSIDSIVGLYELKEIGLGYNTDLSDLSSFYSLQYIDKLTSIDLSAINMHQQFSVNGKIKFPASASLEKLTLRSSSLTNADLDDMTKFTNLKIVDLSANEQIDEAGLNSYFNSEVALESVNISDLKIRELPDLNNQTMLKSLKFDNSRNLYKINSLYDSTLPNLEELSFNNCNSIHFSNEYTQHGIDEIVESLPKLKTLSIVDGIHWLDSEMYSGLQNKIKASPAAADTINPNDLEIELFEGEKVSNKNIITYPRKIYFSLSELLSDSTRANNKYTLKFADGKYKCVLSLVNDSTAKNNNVTVCIPNDFFEFSIYGTVNEQYNFSVEIMSRKRATFDLVLDNVILNGNNSHPVWAANESDITLHARGERVELNAPNKDSNAVYAYDLTLVCDTEKPFKINGHDGKSGGTGISSPTSTNVNYLNRKGENGTNGTAAIRCNSLAIYEVNSSNVYLTGGNGGNGGRGGNCQKDGAWEWDFKDDQAKKEHMSGGPGGDAGNGGAAVEYVREANCADANLKGGNAGTPGDCGSYDNTGSYKGPFYEQRGNYGSDGAQTKHIESL